MPARTSPDSTDIEPMVPIMPTERTRPDGGEPQRPRRSRPSRSRDRPADTSYASEYTRDDEEIDPLVEDLR